MLCCNTYQKDRSFASFFLSVHLYGDQRYTSIQSNLQVFNDVINEFLLRSQVNALVWCVANYGPIQGKSAEVWDRQIEHHWWSYWKPGDLNVASPVVFLLGSRLLASLRACLSNCHWQDAVYLCTYRYRYMPMPAVNVSLSIAPSSVHLGLPSVSNI